MMNLDSSIAFFLALIPILSIVLGLSWLKIRSDIVMVISWILACIVAFAFFGLNPRNIALASTEGAVVALWPIVAIIFAAIYLYNISVASGDLERIKIMLSGISNDPRIQVLLISWGLGAFIDGMSGYGVSVAIPAGILISLGFDPFKASLLSLLANTAPTAFGAVGIPITALADLLGLDVIRLGFLVSIQLLPIFFFLPFGLVMLTGGSWKSIKGVVGITLACSISFVVVQLLVTAFMGAELAAVLSALVSMLVVAILAQTFYKDQNLATTHPTPLKKREAFLAWLPYIITLALVMISSPFSPLYPYFSVIKNHLTIYPESNGVDLKWLASPGLLIFTGATLGGLLRGLSLSTLIGLIGQTALKLWRSALVVIFVISISKVMSYSGMILSLAQFTQELTGSFYPFLSPFIGALGTFVTGSDMGSNILFGELQYSVAAGLGIDPYWLAAANTSGATGGKMISPQSIAVAVASVGLVGKESHLLSKLFPIAFLYVALMGALVWGGLIFF